MDLHISDLGYQDKPEKINYRILFRLLKHVWPYRGRVLMASLMMLIATVTTLAGPYIIKVAIDSAILTSDYKLLNMLTLLYSFTFFLNWFSSYWQNYLMSWVGQRVIFNLRQAIFEKLQGLGFKFYDRRSTGEIMSRVINDIDALNEFITWGVVHIGGDLIVLVGIIIIMLSEHLLLTLVSLVTFPFFLLVSTLFRNHVIEAYREVRSKMAEVNSYLQENISGFKVVQSFVRESKNSQDFSLINHRNLKANIRAAGLFAVYLPVVEVVGALGMALLIWYGGREVIRGAIQIGTLYLFLDYLTRFYAPLRDLSQIYNNFQSAMAAGEKYFQIMDAEPNVKEGPKALKLLEIKGKVEFKAVSFAYEEGNNVLEDINITVEPGQTVALVGPTGAGKTTLISLLCRFYDPQRGFIKIDDYDLKDVKVVSLREQIGLALQDALLFTGTIKENIRYGRPGADNNEVEQAADAVYIHDFISSLPEGYDTKVEERGSNFSMGQRQLISFARVLLRNPRIMILDEATSSVDTHTEVSIRSALKAITSQRTSFIIAHRLSTIRSADKILVMDQGRVVQQGSHQDLVSVPGLYQDLLNMQLME
ncbi:MAG: ABC transporter ATP-binding protein [Candidatus Contubernalis sp.]|nr:ABC transporter ATP-binding protein [Candidatus Contubernalis sp.]